MKVAAEGVEILCCPEGILGGLAGCIMAVQALVQPEHRGHLLGDVPVLFLGAALLAALTPRRPPARS